MRWLLFSAVLGATAASPWASAEGNVSLNTISRVEVTSTAVTIIGSDKPNYTTFTMNEPPRLVIDVTDAVMSDDVPSQIEGSGAITVVKTATYQSGNTSIARVILAFETPMEADISQVDGLRLLVKLSSSKGETPTVAEPAPTPPEKPVSGSAKLQETPAPAPTPSSTPTAAQDDELDEAARQAALQEEQPEKAKPSTAKEEDDIDEAARRAAMEADKPDETKPEKRRPVVERKKQKVQRKQVVRAFRESASTLQFVGFSHDAGTSRIFLRTDTPVQFQVRESSDDRVVVELENTLIGELRNRLALDMSYFDSPIESVKPKQMKGPTLVAEIKLRAPVTLRTQQDGNEVYLDFTRK